MSSSNSAEDKVLAYSDQMLDNVRLEHDIHASLAIINGFNQALEASVSELCGKYQAVLGSHAPDLGAEQIQHLTDSEADCVHCLSRLKSSVDRLSAQLSAKQIASGRSEQSGPELRAGV